MDIFEIMSKNKIFYIEKEYEPNIKLLKIGIKEKVTVAVLFNTTGSFTADRDLFYYLSNQKENYAFLLVNQTEQKMYYIEFKDKINWLKSSFERCDKDKLHFGKIILQKLLIG